MTFEFYGWIIEYYVLSISPGHGNSGRGHSESRGYALRYLIAKKVSDPRSRKSAPLAHSVPLTMAGQPLLQLADPIRAMLLAYRRHHGRVKHCAVAAT